IGGVKVRIVRRRQRRIIQREIARRSGSKIGNGPRDTSVVAVKTSLKRPLFAAVITQVPLARHVGMVTCGLERLSQRNALLVQVPRVPWRGIGLSALARVLGEYPHACLMRMQARQQRS